MSAAAPLPPRQAAPAWFNELTDGVGPLSTQARHDFADWLDTVKRRLAPNAQSPIELLHAALLRPSMTQEAFVKAGRVQPERK